MCIGEGRFFGGEGRQARGLTEADLLVDVEVLSSAQMADLMAEQDVVLSF